MNNRNFKVHLMGPRGRRLQESTKIAPQALKRQSRFNARIEGEGVGVHVADQSPSVSLDIRVKNFVITVCPF
jgi:hypothetical protein